jgi:hypothetical protein
MFEFADILYDEKHFLLDKELKISNQNLIIDIIIILVTGKTLNSFFEVKKK